MIYPTACLVFIGCAISPNEVYGRTPYYIFRDPPTSSPTSSPSTSSQPSLRPSSRPTSSPTFSPSSQPSDEPTSSPSSLPTASPSFRPSLRPSIQPTASRPPSSAPTKYPSAAPTLSTPPSFSPSLRPSHQPSISMQPTQPVPESPVMRIYTSFMETVGLTPSKYGFWITISIFCLVLCLIIGGIICLVRRLRRLRCCRDKDQYSRGYNESMDEYDTSQHSGSFSDSESEMSEGDWAEALEEMTETFMEEFISSFVPSIASSKCDKEEEDDDGEDVDAPPEAVATPVRPKTKQVPKSPPVAIPTNKKRNKEIVPVSPTINPPKPPTNPTPIASPSTKRKDVQKSAHRGDVQVASTFAPSIKARTRSSKQKETLGTPDVTPQKLKSTNTSQSNSHVSSSDTPRKRKRKKSRHRRRGDEEEGGTKETNSSQLTEELGAAVTETFGQALAGLSAIGNHTKEFAASTGKAASTIGEKSTDLLMSIGSGSKNSSNSSSSSRSQTTGSSSSSSSSDETNYGFLSKGSSTSSEQSVSTATYSKAESEAESKRSLASQDTSLWDGMNSLPESANAPSQDNSVSSNNYSASTDDDDDIASAVGRGREAARRDEETPSPVPMKESERKPVAIAPDEVSTVASEEHYLPRYTCM